MEDAVNLPSAKGGLAKTLQKESRGSTGQLCILWNREGCRRLLLQERLLWEGSNVFHSLSLLADLISKICLV